MYAGSTALSHVAGARLQGYIVPAMPEKSAVQKFQMQADFIRERMRALQVPA